MNIQDAIIKAEKAGKPIERAFGEGELKMRVMPTDSDEGCLVTTNAHPERYFRRWQPRKEDLMADDWEIAEG